MKYLKPLSLQLRLTLLNAIIFLHHRCTHTDISSKKTIYLLLHLDHGVCFTAGNSIDLVCNWPRLEAS